MARPRRKRSRVRTSRPVRGRLFAYAVLLGLGAALAYVIYLDVQVRSQFDGGRWAVPARVYARPLELYPGRRLGPEELIEELRVLEYRRVSVPTEPGSYARSGSRVQLYTRPFEYWDGSEPARMLELQFRGGEITALRDVSAHRGIELARLDPAYIGGIYPAHHEDRILVRLEEVPPLLIGALLAVEDRGFMEHAGLDLRAIVRAARANLRAGAAVQGGSTLSQQLVKNYFLSNERTLWRKAREAVMTLLLEWHYDKPEILEAYFNEVYLGQDGRRAVHGVGLASQFYFGRPLERLSVPQLATLVALVRGPSYYDPQRHPERLLARRNQVLRIMAAEGLIDPTEATLHSRAGLEVRKPTRGGLTPYPAFLDLVRRQLRRDYRDADLSSAGLRIFTTLDPRAQTAAERALSEQIRRAGRAELQGAAILTRPDSGEVLALVGDRNPRFPGFNRALDAHRPIGSLVKPAIVLSALSDPQRYHLLTPVEDRPVAIANPDGSTWNPRNYDGISHGTVSIYEALIHSYNQASVRLGMALGVEQVRDTLVRLGLAREVPAYPALLLGAVSLSPYEVAQVYQTLANGGFRTPLRAIREVLTATGQPLQRYPLRVTQAVDPAATAAVNSALQAVVAYGTARGLHQWLPAELKLAGKTGTTNNMRDSWFAGFSGSHLGVVWLGRDDNASIGLTGSSGALRVWGQALAALDAQPLQLALPERTESLMVDPGSGGLAGRGCADAVELVFVAGSGPRESAPCAGGGAHRAGFWGANR